MSYDPFYNQSSFGIKGDIGAGFGMLGLTSRLIIANGTPVSHTPGVDFSNYFSHYNFDIQADTDFTLSAIGVGGVSIGHTLCIEAVTNTPTDPEPVLRILDSLSNQIGEIENGGKIFLVATTSSRWQTAYAIPEGRDNWLIVYTGPYPKVRLLPIKKEFDYNGSYQYGIKSIESYDYTEPSYLINQTGYTNPNRFIVEGSTNTDLVIDTISAPTVQSIISCQSCNFIANGDGGSVASMIACHGESVMEQMKDGKGLVQLGCQGCTHDNSLSPSKMFNVVTAGSQLCTTTTNGSNVINTNLSNAVMLGSNFSAFDVTTAGPSTCIGSIGVQQSNITSCSYTLSAANVTSDILRSVNSAMIGSISSDITDGNNVTVIAADTSTSLTDAHCLISGTSVDSENNSTFTTLATNGAVHKGNFISGEICGHLNALEDTAGTNLASCTATSITGNGSNTYSALTGWANIAGGVTVLSSHNMTPDFTAGDYRYLVMGGVNTVTWSIDSKTGNHYGNTFTPGQALPGFAEMFPNIINGIIPVGRLLQIENGAVRLARDGETGFMISRPFDTAAFVGGNPYLGWHKMFKTDVFGNKLVADYSADEYIAVLRKMGKSEKAIQQLNIEPGQYTFGVLNPDYDPAVKYIPRSERLEEWTCCEKSGIVIVELADSPSVGSYLISGPDGKAKKANRITNIKVLEVIDNQYAKVDISNQYIPERATLKASTSAGDSTLIFADTLLLQDLTIKSFVVELKSRRKLKLKLRFNTSQAIYDTLYADLYSSKIAYEFDLSVKKRKGCLIVTAELSDTIEAGQYSVRIMPSNALGVTVSLKLE